jgi:hypothetical protein
MRLLILASLLAIAGCHSLDAEEKLQTAPPLPPKIGLKSRRGLAYGDSMDSHPKHAEKNALAVQNRMMEAADRWQLYCSENFCDESKEILEKNKMLNVWLQNSGRSTSQETIEWTQASRCWWSCSETYNLATYSVWGSEIPVYVYVSMNYDLPYWLYTGGGTDGYQGLLHFGNLIYDASAENSNSESQVIFFVVHPNDWGPFQHRFKTNSLTKAVNGAMNAIVSGVGGALATAGLTSLIASSAIAGGTLGSVVPVGGTAAGIIIGVGAALVAYALASQSDDYLGDYLRYIG